MRTLFTTLQYLLSYQFGTIIKIKKMKDQLLGLIRHALTFVGGALVAKGLVDDIAFQEILGAVMTLVGTVWSILSKKKAA